MHVNPCPMPIIVKDLRHVSAFLCLIFTSFCKSIQEDKKHQEMIASYNHGYSRLWENQKHLPEGETKAKSLGIKQQSSFPNPCEEAWKRADKRKKQNDSLVHQERWIYTITRLILLLIICQVWKSHWKHSFVIPLSTHYKEMMLAISDENREACMWTIWPLRIVSNTGQFWKWFEWSLYLNISRQGAKAETIQWEQNWTIQICL